MDYQQLAEEVLRSLPVLRSRVRRLDEGFRREIFTLGYVVKHGGGVSPGEISSAFAVSSARVAVTLNGLEEKGLITRRIDPADRRHVIVDPTPAGTEQAARTYRAMVEKTQEILRRLGDEDAQALVRLVHKLSALASEGEGS